jgi:hypothetical protein
VSQHIHHPVNHDLRHLCAGGIVEINPGAPLIGKLKGWELGAY